MKAFTITEYKFTKCKINNSSPLFSMKSKNCFPFTLVMVLLSFSFVGSFHLLFVIVHVTVYCGTAYRINANSSRL